MDDEKIIELYWQRENDAIAQTANKYGNYCYQIAFNLLRSKEDSEECVNDTYWKAWTSIPPNRPNRLSAYLGKITRNLALNRYEMTVAKKRCPANTVLSADLFQPYLADTKSIDPYEHTELADTVNRFLKSLPRRTMIIFLRRYWYFYSISDIANSLGISENNVKVILHRTRERFSEHLRKEGFIHE